MNWDFKNFSQEEFACKHTGANGISLELVDKLQLMRDLYKKPIIITSGYRSPEHPIEKSKDKPGAHTEGLAVDISCEKGDAYELLGLALQLDFTGIGVNQKGNGRFLHLDISKNRKPRPTVWSY